MIFAAARAAGLVGRKVSGPVEQAAQLVATAVGQHLDEGADGVFRIGRLVARDRVISTVDPAAQAGTPGTPMIRSQASRHTFSAAGYLWPHTE